MPRPMIDLRSDTVTRPTPGMRRAMAEAEVGDDVLGDDPTVQALEERTASLLGKEAAVFVPSGTMANQIAIGVHTRPGDEVLCGLTSHVYVWEAGGIARLSGATARPFEGDGGLITLDDLQNAIRPDDPHYVRTRLVCLENTHNRAGGRVHPIEEVAAIARWARGHDLAMHLDGARLMNAVVASGHSAREWGQHFDTVSICFSKGLGAPVGSALAGTREAIRKARRLRKLFGGGMRQAGIIAAAALYALENNVDRLADDHAHARLLADAFEETEGFSMDCGPVETNLVWVRVDPSLGTAPEVAAYLRSHGVLVSALGPQVLRAWPTSTSPESRSRRSPTSSDGSSRRWSRPPRLSTERNRSVTADSVTPADKTSSPVSDAAPRPRARLPRTAIELFAISFLVLFLELACIRWFASTVIFLTFFTNFVLMGCFLGVAVGCLAAGRRGSLIHLLVPLAIVSAGAACGFLWLYSASTRVMIDVGSQQSPQLIYFGTDARVKDPSKWVVPMELLAAVFFVFIAMLFVGIGQEMGRRFAAIEDRVAAYTADILGSLTGIAAFGLLSYLWVPAWAWFAIALAIGIAFVPRRRAWHAAGALVAVGLIALADWPRDALGVETEVTWSPYYQVLYKPRYRSIDVNHIGHQGMMPINRSGPRVHAAAPPRPRGRGRTVRRRPDHRGRLGQRRRRRAGDGGVARGRRRDRPGYQRPRPAPSSRPAL